MKAEETTGKKKELDPESVAVGARIRLARHAKGITMDQLSEAADTSTQFLSKVEKGEQNMTAVKFGKLARALGVSSDYLLYGHEKEWGLSGVAAEYMGRLSPVDRAILADCIVHLRAMLDELAPEEK